VRAGFGAEVQFVEFDGLVVCAVAHGLEIGVDVEPYTRAKTIEEVAERFFSARELEQLEPLRGKSGGSAG